MKVFNNVTDIVRDDMASTIKKGSKVSIAAACFSMYAYNELKKQLEGVDELRICLLAALPQLILDVSVVIIVIT